MTTALLVIDMQGFVDAARRSLELSEITAAKLGR